MIAQAIRGVANVSQALGLKRLLPSPLVDSLRSLLLKRSVKNFADRRYLEDSLLPALAKGSFKRVLFVGCEPYTHDYNKIFANEAKEYWTTDIKPDAARWGEADRHVTADIKQIDDHFSKAYFDLVILNGVLGFGVNDETGIEQALRSTAKIISPNGVLLLGWNSNLVEVCPTLSQSIKTAFRSTSIQTLPHTKSFDDANVPHTFASFCKIA